MTYGFSLVGWAFEISSLVGSTVSNVFKHLFAMHYSECYSSSNSFNTHQIYETEMMVIPHLQKRNLKYNSPRLHRQLSGRARIWTQATWFWVCIISVMVMQDLNWKVSQTTVQLTFGRAERSYDSIKWQCAVSTKGMDEMSGGKQRESMSSTMRGRHRHGC